MSVFQRLPLEDRIQVSYRHLERMRRPNGGYIASPYTAEDGSGDAYNVYWIRDIMYATYANEYLGCFDRMVESFRLVMDIFKRFHLRIIEASIRKPHVREQTGMFLPARVHPTTLDSITDAWGHHQLDVFGLFMYKTGDLIRKGYGFRFTPEDFTLISHIRNYIYNMGFEADYGMWEEGPEEHASSFGAVLGGLTMWHDQGFYDYKYRQKIQIWHHVPVSERMVAEGSAALARLLPRESQGRPYDLAQLSLLWPYNIVDHAMKRRVLAHIEKHLLGSNGVSRYPGDTYCGKGLHPASGESAQWPLGLAWLSICYSKLAQYETDYGPRREPIRLDWDERQTCFEKAIHYFRLLESNMTEEGWVPEMYVGGQAGHNTPLAWAQSFHIVAAQCLVNLAAAHPHHFRLPSDVRRGDAATVSGPFPVPALRHAPAGPSRPVPGEDHEPASASD